MFYGRVDVYWPDGPVESYRLNKATIAVGRSTGNDIVLDTTAISRYHITLTFKDHQAWLEDLDSANGTYVDGVRLRAHEAFALRGGEEIQIGDIRLIYHPPVATERGSEETTQRVVLTRLTYRVELDGPDMGVAPGAHAQARLKIENLGEETDQYFVEIDGLPKGWARVDRVELELAPGESGQVVISFKPLRRSETQPGEHAFVIRVRSKSVPAETMDVPAVLTVLPYSGFGMALGESLVSNGQSFQLYVHNQGNAPLPVEITGADPARALRVRLSAARVLLAPGERKTIVGTVHPRRPHWFGTERRREFAIVARAHDPSGFVASVPAIFVDRGMLPGWVPLLVVPLLVVGLLLIISVASLVLGQGKDDTLSPPVITTFEISRTVMSLGETAQVSWQVSQADTLVLEWGQPDSRERVSVEVTANSYPLVFDDTGRYDVTLVATNRSASVHARLPVEVRPAVTLTVTVLDGTELVRNVAQDVQVTWTVGGAREQGGGYNVWVTSSDRKELLIAPPMPSVGQQTVTVSPHSDQAEWLVTLTAEGPDGVQASTTQKVPVVFPVCELVAERTLVRGGPGEAYPAVLPPQPPAGAPEGTLSYSPVARDPSGEWLQVPIDVESRLGWVPVADFVCTNFDPQRLVVTHDLPPLPVTPTAIGETGGDATEGTLTASPSSATPTPTPIG